jgi:hypothetical protein
LESRVERPQTRGDVEEILGSGLRGQRRLEGKIGAQKTSDDEEWRDHRGEEGVEDRVEKSFGVTEARSS